MVGFGVLGWVLRKMDVPLVPIILGILFGNAMESNLRRAISISNGDWSVLVGSSLPIGPWVVAFVGFILPIIFGAALKRRMKMAATKEEEGELVD